jgi:hypothetical protein
LTYGISREVARAGLAFVDEGDSIIIRAALIGAVGLPNILPNFIESSDAAGSSSTTYSLAIGQTGQGVISSLGDHDWYRLNLVAGQTYTFAAVGTGTNSLRDTYIYLHNSAGTIIGRR